MKLTEYTAERRKLEDEIAQLNEQLKALDFLWKSRWNRVPEPPPLIVRPSLGERPPSADEGSVSTERAQAGTWMKRVREALPHLPDRFDTAQLNALVLRRAGLSENPSRLASIGATIKKLIEERVIRLETPGRGGKPNVYAKNAAASVSGRAAAPNKEGSAAS